MIIEQQLTITMRKPRLFVIEGADCTGKSTLARYIANKFNAAYFHATWSPNLNLAMGDYLSNMTENAKVCLTVSGLDVVMDRHWPSEYCYALGLNRQSPMIDYAKLNQALVDLDVTYIFCFRSNPQLAIAMHDANKDIKHPYTREEYLSVYKEYLNLFGLGSQKKLLPENTKIALYCIDTYNSEAKMQVFVADLFF